MQSRKRLLLVGRTCKVRKRKAVHMIGMERNGDFVKMAAYALLLAHLDFSPYTVSPIA